MKTCLTLFDPEIYNISDNARLLALRWDVIPSGLVLDLDVTMDDGWVPHRRAWLSFEKVEEFVWPCRRARVPTGVFLTNATCSAGARGICTFTLRGMFPRFEGNEPQPGVYEEIVIKAHRIKGAVSQTSAFPTKFGLEFDGRRALATDDQLLDCLTRQSQPEGLPGRHPMYPRELTPSHVQVPSLVGARIAGIDKHEKDLVLVTLEGVVGRMSSDSPESPEHLRGVFRGELLLNRLDSLEEEGALSGAREIVGEEVHPWSSDFRWDVPFGGTKSLVLKTQGASLRARYGEMSLALTARTA